MGAPRRKPSVFAVGVGVALITAGLAAGRIGMRAHAAQVAAQPALGSRRTPASEPGEGVVLHVPHLPASIVLDGDTDDPGWTSPPGPARTGPFLLASGMPARPYSEARAVWGDGHLYLALYAADEDIRSRTGEHDGPLWLDDSFRVVFAQGDVERAIEVSPRGVVTDAMRARGGAFDYGWESGVHVSPELDGTINQPNDADEEWVIEMAIPFEALGMRGERGESIGFSLRRCDVPKGSSRVCAGWGEGPARGALRLE
jgi:hypothetical protein